MLTHLPIYEDEPCRMLLLRKNPYESPSRYHEIYDVWQPLGLPISGLYDDYGCLQPESIQKDFAYRFMREQILDIHEVDIDNINSSKDDRRFGDLFAWGYSKTVKATRLRQETSYGIALICDAAYEAAVAYARQINVQTWWHEDKPTLETYLRDSFKLIRPDLDLWAYYWSLYPGLKASLTDQRLLDAPLPPVAKQMQEEDSQRPRELYFEAEEREYAIQRALDYRRESLGWSRRLMKALAKDETGEGIERYIDWHCLNDFIRYTRRMYAPQGAMGDPSPCLNAQLVLAKVALTKVEKHIADEKERYGDDYDE